MTDTTQPNPVETNFSFSLFTAVDKDFKNALDAGCYQKKSLLTKLLQVEIERLDKALAASNPPKVTQYVRDIQNQGDLKAYWVKHQVLLPSVLVERIQEVCKSKGVLRDAWVNRVIFLATGTNLFHAVLPLDELKSFDYFEDDSNNRDDAIELATMRLTGELDPLWRLHEVFREIHDGRKGEVGDLYRFKIFDAHKKPRKPMPPRRKESASDELKRLRTDWLLHKFSWCITCWADEADLEDQIEPDWDTLEL